MLPKKHRLSLQGDFHAVFQGRIKARSGPFRMMCNENNLTYNRFGFVVSLVVSKKAVIRNRIRRRLYAIVQHMFPTIRPGYDCVVWVYPEAVDLGYQEIERHIQQMFERTRMLKL